MPGRLTLVVSSSISAQMASSISLQLKTHTSVTVDTHTPSSNLLSHVIPHKCQLPPQPQAWVPVLSRYVFCLGSTLQPHPTESKGECAAAFDVPFLQKFLLWVVCCPVPGNDCFMYSTELYSCSRSTVYNNLLLCHGQK